MSSNPSDENLISQDRPRAVATVAPRFSESKAEPIKLEYAGFWLRFLANLIDVFLLSIASGIISSIFTGSTTAAFTRLIEQSQAGGDTNQVEPTGMLSSLAISYGLAFVASTVLTWLYYAFLESGKRQGTLGKMALGIIVTDQNDKRLNFARATGRYFAKFIVFFIVIIVGYLGFMLAISSGGGNDLLGLGFFGAVFNSLGLIGLVLLISYAMAGFTAKKQALHDMVAKTLVYKK